MKKILKIVLCITLTAAIGILAVSCKGDDEEIDYSQIESVTVDPTVTAADFEGFALSTFDISQITLIVKYKDSTDDAGNTVAGETKTTPAGIYMVKAEDQAKLSVAGTKSITLIYGKFEITFSLKLYDDTVTQYKVYFYDEDGETLLGDIQYVAAGGRATQPTLKAKAGFTFVGWIDMETDKNTTFDNIQKDMRLKAEYLADTYTVSFCYDDNGADVLISDETIASGESVEDNYPDAPEREGYVFSAWLKDSDTKYYAQYIKQQYAVSFVFRKYADGRYADAFTKTSVEYNCDDVTVTEIGGARCDGVSEANDYQFMYWYVERNGKRLKIDFPYDMTGGMCETTFYAYYVDMNRGSEGLVYKKGADGFIMVSGYNGEDGVIVIPEYAVADGERLNVTEIGDGVFKKTQATAFAVSGENKYFRVSDGALYNAAGTVLYAYPSGLSESEFTLADTATEINAYAFYGADSLMKVNFDNALKAIGDYAFSECVSLNTVTVTENVKIIGDRAFYMSSYSVLESISFEGTKIVSIGDEAFYGLNSLTSFELPASLTSLGDAAFYGCVSLASVNADTNSSFNVSGGALYSGDFSVLYLYPSLYNGNVNPEITVSDKCGEIKRGAFFNANIECVTFSSDVRFDNDSIICPSLKAVRIDTDGSSIGDAKKFSSEFLQAFGKYPPSVVYVKSDNDDWDGLDIEGVSVEKYDGWTGYNDYSDGYIYVKSDSEVKICGYNGSETELSVPNMIDDMPVTAIADDAFNGNKKLVSVSVPVSVVSIGTRAFYDCTALKTVVLSSLASAQLVSVGDYAFAGCRSLSTVSFYETLALASFGKYVFDDTPLIENADGFLIIGGVLVTYAGNAASVTVPDGVTYISTDAFKDKGDITSVSFGAASQLRIIDEYAFINCTGITEICLPRSVTEVKDYAFYGCEYLFLVKYLGNSASTEVGYYAYYRAASHYADGNVTEQFADSTLFTLTYKVDNENYPQDGLAFVTAKEVTLPAGSLFVGWYFDNTYKTLAVFPLAVTSDTTLYARIENEDYVSDGLEYALDEDGDAVIIGYRNGTDNYIVVSEKYKDADVVGISENAFGETVVQIDLPDTLNVSTGEYKSNILSIGIDAFVNSTWYDNIAGDFVIYDNLLLGYKGDAKTVIIPSDVTVIADGAFRNNTSVEYAVIPDTVTLIPEQLFSGCVSLKKIVLGKETMTIGKKAFYGCSELSDINFSDLTALAVIESDAFDGTAWLSSQPSDCIIVNGILYKYQGEETTLHIPSGVTIIADYAFAENSRLVSVYLPTSVSIIRNYAFADMISLNAIYVFNGENSLAYIMEGAFENCYNLRLFDLSQAVSLAEIGDSAFENCASLKTLYIPEKLILLGDGAFRNSGLVNVSVANESGLAKISDSAFENCRSLYSFVLNGENVLTSVGKRAFYNCTALAVFDADSAKIALVDDYGFYNCRSLTDVSIQEKYLKTIGKDAVYRLGYVVGMNLNMTIFGNILVSYYGLAKTVTVPASVTLIYDGAFEGNTSVVTVLFEQESRLARINDRAFYGCSKLTDIDFPASLTSVGYQVMDGTAWYANKLSSEEYITINNTLVKYNASETKQAVISDGITTIIKGAFDGTSVYDISIGQDVTEIDDGAFDGLEKAEWLENGVTRGGWTLTVETSVPPTLDYKSEFENCVAVYLNDDNALAVYKLNDSWAVQSAIMSVVARFEMKYSIVDGEGEAIDSENIHAIYSAKNVNVYDTTAKKYVFVGWFKEASYENALTYPYILTKDSVIYAKCIDYDIGSNPSKYYLAESGEKDGMYSITGYTDTIDKKVVIITEQSDKSVYSITGSLGYIEYSGDEYTKYVYDTDSGGFVLYNEYDFEEGVQTYRRNTVIEELTFANDCTIEVLGDNCFAGMTNLTKVTIPSSVKRISKNAFADCGKLSEIVFADGIKDLEIDTDAFANCTGLTKITIPDSVAKLGDAAFAGCVNLKEIYLEAATPIVLYDNAMPFEIISGLRIYIPAGTYATYSAFWASYDGVDVDGSRYIEELPAASGQ